MHANRVDTGLVANIGLFPHDRLLETIERVYRRFQSTGPGIHLDMKRIDGKLTCQGYPIFKWQGAAHLAEMVAAFEQEGVRSANTHTMHVRENGLKPIDDREIAFRRAMDPLGLLNPGKFSADDVKQPGAGTQLPTRGWEYRRTGS
jgi:FAD/FMN-containing dehydrogenase